MEYLVRAEVFRKVDFIVSADSPEEAIQKVDNDQSHIGFSFYPKLEIVKAISVQERYPESNMHYDLQKEKLDVPLQPDKTKEI